MVTFFTKAINKTKNIEHDLYLKKKRKKLHNMNPTIIANNCLGGVISHDLGIHFNSPCVNQAMLGKDYIKFLKNMDYYLSLTPVSLNKFYKDTDWGLTQLGDIICIFGHEKDIETSIKNWEKRKHRINKDNMFFMMTESLEATYEDLLEFDSLPFKNKLLFTHKPYKELKSAYYFKGFEDLGEVGVLSDLKPTFWQRRYIDDFDYVSFLNQ